jgi:nucleoside-diphosphate-sugar epimerase
MKIVIFGGAGFVGCNLISLLQKSYQDIVVVDKLWFWRDELEFRQKAKIESFVKIVNKDIRDKDIFSLLDEGCCVINLACLSNDPTSDICSKFTRDVSYNGVINLINSATSKKVKKFIQTSSTSVYGIKAGKLVDESEKEEPITLYSEIKTEIDNYLRYLMRYSEMDITILRPATLYGYSPRLRLDVLINSLLIRCIEENAMFIHGGSQYRPCLHVEDLCLAYKAAIENPEAKNNIFNVTNENFSVNEIVQMIIRYNPDTIIHRQHVIDQRSYQVDSNKIKHVLGLEFQKKVEDEIPILQSQILNGDFNRNNCISLDVIKRIIHD